VVHGGAPGRPSTGTSAPPPQGYPPATGYPSPGIASPPLPAAGWPSPAPHGPQFGTLPAPAPYPPSLPHPQLSPAAPSDPRASLLAGLLSGWQTLDEAAAELRVGGAYLWELVQAGHLRAWALPGALPGTPGWSAAVRLRREDVLALLQPIQPLQAFQPYQGQPGLQPAAYQPVAPAGPVVPAAPVAPAASGAFGVQLR
jgi:hypothetical protein